MGQATWFYRTAAEWIAISQQLKLMPCPHCQVVGALNRHGSGYGFDDRNPPRKIVRARRVFCSNRNARPGCGQTFSVWLADKIRRLSLTTATLWAFLQGAVANGISAAVGVADCQRSERTWWRIWKRFDLGQSQLRTVLAARCPPPELTADRPAAHVLAHLRAAFPDAGCPIAAFQHTLRTFFV